jgi:hypothetical protein
MSQESKNKRLCFIEWDGYHHWEKYLVTYDQALSLIPIMINKVPSITITDYDLNKIQRETYIKGNRNNEERSSNDESIIQGDN